MRSGESEEAGPAQPAVERYLERLRAKVWPRAADVGAADLMDELRDHLL
ncbi:MAG: hypothetical protein QOF99_4273, partial [Pseudonocardiales bacterium]|nr:hypothetical protein [Pseudonocardiales bacterium]